MKTPYQLSIKEINWVNKLLHIFLINGFGNDHQRLPLISWSNEIPTGWSIEQKEIDIHLLGVYCDSKNSNWKEEGEIILYKQVIIDISKRYADYIRMNNIDINKEINSIQNNTIHHDEVTIENSFECLTTIVLIHEIGHWIDHWFDCMNLTEIQVIDGEVVDMVFYRNRHFGNNEKFEEAWAQLCVWFLLVTEYFMPIHKPLFDWLAENQSPKYNTFKEIKNYPIDIILSRYGDWRNNDRKIELGLFVLSLEENEIDFKEFSLKHRGEIGGVGIGLL